MDAEKFTARPFFFREKIQRENIASRSVSFFKFKMEETNEPVVYYSEWIYLWHCWFPWSWNQFKRFPIAGTVGRGGLAGSDLIEMRW